MLSHIFTNAMAYEKVRFSIPLEVTKQSRTITKGIW